MKSVALGLCVTHGLANLWLNVTFTHLNILYGYEIREPQLKTHFWERVLCTPGYPVEWSLLGRGLAVPMLL